MKKTILSLIFLLSLKNIAFTQEFVSVKAEISRKIEIAFTSEKINIDSFKVNVIGINLTQPIILTPDNLGEWGKISVNVIPPESLSLKYDLGISLDSGETWKSLPESFYAEYEPEDEKTYSLAIRIITNDNVETKSFKDYPITFLKNPEKYFSDLIRNVISISFNNKETSLFLKYISKNYNDPWGNHKEELEDRLNNEFEKYKSIKFTIKNLKIARLDVAKFKVEFDWTKTSEIKEENSTEHLFGKSVYFFENDSIIQANGDPIFTDLLGVKQIAQNPGVLKGGSVNLVPGASFEFTTENTYKDNGAKGDIGIIKDENLLALYVPGGGIQDMGIIQISEIVEAPDAGYVESAPVIIGHSYCLRDNNNRYAKLQITYVEGAEIGQTSSLVSINWIYQENESRSLKP